MNVFSFFKKKSPAGDEVRFKITGMNCTSCGMEIDNGLEDLEGVTGSSTNFSKRMTTVYFNPQVVTRKQIETKIQALGFTPLQIK